MRDQDVEKWIAEARNVSVKDALLKLRLWSKAMEKDKGVPCPRPGCGGHDRFAVNERKNIWHCRASGHGGDAIALLGYLRGMDFFEAVEYLTGRTRPDGKQNETEEERAARKERWDREQEELRRVAEQKQREQQETEGRFREREQRKCVETWEQTRRIAGTMAEDFFALRGIDVPADAHLGFHPSLAYWDDGTNRLIHKGPAIIGAALSPRGELTGIQRIWIDLKKNKGKAEIIHPETGEVLASKKSRGSVKGATVFLGGKPDPDQFPGDRVPVTREFLGEGIVTTLAVRQALLHSGSTLFASARFRTALSLTYMAGPAAGRVRHPTMTKTDRLGRVRPHFVPSNVPRPDVDYPLIHMPASIRELYLLGDGDSEPFWTRMALERAAARFANAYPALTVRLAMAANTTDFDDMWQRERELVA
jgi:hypothetical protein